MIRLIFVVFVVSGFVGLMYEAIWSRYLKLLLGHSSAGQILTLAIFMGGLGVGSFLIGRFIKKVKRPLRTYALVEAVVGVLGLLYHPIYTSTTGAYFHWVTGAEMPYAAQIAAKLTLCLLTTLPMAILLGMTFPLIAVGVMRQLGDGGVKSLSLLYFTNSLGAAAGIVATSYYFIKNFGTPGTLIIAAVGNLVIAFIVLLVSKKLEETGETRLSFEVAKSSDVTEIQDSTPLENVPAFEKSDVRVWLAVAALTGFASFIYEVGWIRLVSLLMGSSTHSFDIMVSAFVLGLAFGGLYSRRLIRTSGSLAIKLGVVQVLMGAFALATIFVHHPIAMFINDLHMVFAKTESAFRWYSVVKYLVCLSFMFPAAFCAGITLPIITYALMRGRKTEKYTGYVYGFNTTGSIIGAALAGYLMIPLLQLKWTIATGALLDTALGVFLIWRYHPVQTVRMISVGALAAMVVTASVYKFDLFVLNLGTYRAHMEYMSTKALKRLKDTYREFHSRDGQTATISFLRSDYESSIRTNGKSDGSYATQLSRKEGRMGDNATMAGVAYLPMRTLSKPYNAAVIGMGTGLTAHCLLGDPLLKEMDLIEIEKEVLNLSRYFRPANERAFTDPRINFVVDDAKSYFYNNNKLYDLIISEPSNPWVSGVSSLFTREFYHHVKRFLRPEGYLVQWLHVYEFEGDLLYSILSALQEEFPDYLLFVVPEINDMVVIAGKDLMHPSQLSRMFDDPEILKDLKREGWKTEDFGPSSLIATSASLAPMVSEHQSNSDYYPIVDESAESAFFRKVSASYLGRRLREFPAMGRELDVRLNVKEQGPESVADAVERATLSPVEEASVTALLPNLGLPGVTPQFENLFYRKLSAIVGVDAWNTHPTVAAYRAVVDAPGSKLEEDARLRFQAVDAYSRGDVEALRKVLPQLIEVQRVGSQYWDQVMMVCAVRSGSPALVEQVKDKYWPENSKQPYEEKAIARALASQIADY